jgi:hypothetical protein
MKWLKNVLVGFDQLANALFGGDPDETISSRCGKREQSSRFCKWLCRQLHKIDKRHCPDSIEGDEGKDAIGY